MDATDLSPPSTQAETRERLWAALEQLCDPEIPVLTLREMGILRELRPAADAPGVWEVLITPTYNGCPAMGQIEDDVRATVQGLGLQVRVLRQLAPAWSTDAMSPAAHEKLRAYGIAAPLPCVAAAAAGPERLRFVRGAADPEPPVPCPRCASLHTVETSHFGSTACKALYKCLACQEPFDYFKPY